MIGSSLDLVLAAPLAAVLLAKATALLALVWMAHIALTRRSAHWRVLLWRMAGLSLAALPLLVLRGPSLTIHLAPAPARAIMPASAGAPLDAPPSILRSALSRVVPPMLAEPAYAPLIAEPLVEPPSTTGADESAPLKSVGAPIAAPSGRAIWPRPSAAQVLLALWLAGVALLCVRRLIERRRWAAILRRAAPAPDALRAAFDSSRRLMVARREIKIVLSRDVPSPVLCGVWRPTILFPACFIGSDHAADWPAILAHELSHVRSGDLAWLGLLQWIRIALWFHPLAWGMGRAYEDVCEQVCDSQATRTLGDRESYTRALARVALAVSRALQPSGGLPMVREPRPARMAKIRRRLRRLEDGRSAQPPARWVAAGSSSLALALFAALACAGFARATAPSLELVAPHDGPILIQAAAPQDTPPFPKVSDAPVPSAPVLPMAAEVKDSSKTAIRALGQPKTPQAAPASETPVSHLTNPETPSAVKVMRIYAARAWDKTKDNDSTAYWAKTVAAIQALPDYQALDPTERRGMIIGRLLDGDFLQWDEARYRIADRFVGSARMVVGDGCVLVRDAPAAVAAMEESLIQARLIDHAPDPVIEFAALNLAPALAGSPTSGDPALVARAAMQAAQKNEPPDTHGRWAWFDPARGELLIADTPANVRRAENYLASLAGARGGEYQDSAQLAVRSYALRPGQTPAAEQLIRGFDEMNPLPADSTERVSVVGDDRIVLRDTAGHLGRLEKILLERNTIETPPTPEREPRFDHLIGRSYSIRKEDAETIKQLIDPLLEGREAQIFRPQEWKGAVATDGAKVNQSGKLALLTGNSMFLSETPNTAWKIETLLRAKGLIQPDAPPLVSATFTIRNPNTSVIEAVVKRTLPAAHTEIVVALGPTPAEPWVQIVNGGGVHALDARENVEALGQALRASGVLVDPQPSAATSKPTSTPISSIAPAPPLRIFRIRPEDAALVKSIVDPIIKPDQVALPPDVPPNSIVLADGVMFQSGRAPGPTGIGPFTNIWDDELYLYGAPKKLQAAYALLHSKDLALVEVRHYRIHPENLNRIKQANRRALNILAPQLIDSGSEIQLVDQPVSLDIVERELAAENLVTLPANTGVAAQALGEQAARFHSTPQPDQK